MLNRTDRYLISRLLKSSLLVSAGLSFVFLFGTSFQLLKDETLSLGQVALIIPWTLPFLLPYLIPISYVATVTLIYAQLVADQEVLAFGSLGISGRSLAWPAILLATVLVGISSWANAAVVPHAQQRRKTTMSSDFQQLFELAQGEHFSRKFKGQGFSLYIRKYDHANLEGIVIHSHAGQAATRHQLQLVARAGRIAQASGSQRLVLVLEDVVATLVSDGQPPVRAHLESYVQGISLGGRRRVKEPERSSAYLRALIEESAARRATSEPEARKAALEASVTLGTRTTLGLAPLLMTLLALPIPLLLRSSNALIPFAIGMSAVCALFLGPLMLAQFLARASGAGWLSYAGIPASLVGAAALAELARRRG